MAARDLLRTCTFKIEATPMPKERARARVVTGKDGKAFATLYTPKRTRKYEEMIGTIARAAWRDVPTSRPVELVVVFALAVPAHWPKWKQELARDGAILPTMKPDQSNLIKSIEDGMNTVVYQDDAQIVGSYTERRYQDTGPDTIRITIREVARLPAGIKTKREAEQLLGR